MAMSILFLLMVFVGQDNVDNDINAFAKLLRQDSIPTVSDFYKYYGDGNEDEIALEAVVCNKAGWGEPQNDPKCLEFHRKRYLNGTNERSLYFEWLKTRLPPNPLIMRIKRGKMYDGKLFKYMDVYATANDVPMSFLYREGDEGMIAQFGKLGIAFIDGRDVDDLLLEDIKAGYAPSLNLK